MHVAIDLGDKYTFLCGWENGRLVTDYCIRVKIPGMTRFVFAAAESFLDREGMREYFSHLYREYILPSRMMVESAAVSYPAVLDLNTQSMILDVLEEEMELPEVTVVPQPLALVNGYNLRNPLRPLSGDIMVLQPDERELNLAFISVMNDGRVILEGQFSGSVVKARKGAETIGFYSSAGWNLDMVLWENDTPYPPLLEDLLKSLPERVNIIGEKNLQSISVDGLSRGLSAQDAPFYNMNFIYPYDFFIEKKNLNQGDNELVKVPFDTTNLELRCNAGYKLLTLDSSGIYNLAEDPERINLRLYQSRTSIASERGQQIPGTNLVLEIDSLKSELPDRVSIYLDLAAASLVLDLKPEKTEPHQLTPFDFQNRLLVLQSKIYDIIKTNEQHPLTYEIEKHILARSRAKKSLPSQIELTLLRLNSILLLWNDK